MQNHPYFTRDQKYFLAHRGFTPPTENTLDAFRRAVECGAEYLETDVRASSDGQAVLLHDPDLERISGLSLKVSDLTLGELKKIHLPEGGQITTLGELLGAFPRSKINIDIKDPLAIIPTMQAIEMNNAHNRVLVSSFSDSRRRQALALFTKPVATSAGGSVVLKARLLSMLGIKLDKTLSGIGALQIPLKMYGVNFKSKRFIKSVLRTGTQIHFWTINDPNQMHELFALGAQAVVTDDVITAKTVINNLS